MTVPYKNQLLILVLLSLFLLSFVKVNEIIYTKNQLIGKGKPALYGKEYKLQKEAYLSLERMIIAAKSQDVAIHVISAYRGFDHQNIIWKRKYDGFIQKGYSSKESVRKVMRYTAIPGTSRHHWGTDIDISNAKTKLSNYHKRKYEQWLDDNAHKFGFYRVYTNNKLREGYNYESWHYSYRNLSKPMLAQYYKLDLEKVLKNENIAGNSHFTKTFLSDYFKKNVLGINDYLY